MIRSLILLPVDKIHNPTVGRAICMETDIQYSVVEYDT